MVSCKKGDIGFPLEYFIILGIIVIVAIIIFSVWNLLKKGVSFT